MTVLMCDIFVAYFFAGSTAGVKISQVTFLFFSSQEQHVALIIVELGTTGPSVPSTVGITQL